ncbi:acyl-CoA dehydrogenase [Blastomyces gilchristii SLH14081]|uniref:Acyl-CoA dehydrogenase n=1 Tax=Blastomyces gilchristii (strain SLH14081) TaxID=559298 RepID=A0A179V161_BLAGS|nr:acyl-CoA dehydrogenase [Blastomyces gilchristii SLH14081]EQL37893.1 acyl-CoA dehydrogenase [Blastomyces dermatitidis ATCC 26199]OAT13137.1 acyl-CoA dehydrogenase [Blastomyces gilchristii SLH14081]
MSETALKSFSKMEVSSHNKDGDMWVIIDQDIYDISKFQDEHPGGKKILLSVAGGDATKKFHKYHRRGILSKYKGTLLIGAVQEPQQTRKSIFGLLKRS